MGDVYRREIRMYGVKTYQDESIKHQAEDYLI